MIAFRYEVFTSTAHVGFVFAETSVDATRVLSKKYGETNILSIKLVYVDDSESGIVELEDSAS